MVMEACVIWLFIVYLGHLGYVDNPEQNHTSNPLQIDANRFGVMPWLNSPDSDFVIFYSPGPFLFNSVHLCPAPRVVSVHVSVSCSITICEHFFHITRFSRDFYLRKFIHMCMSPILSCVHSHFLDCLSARLPVLLKKRPRGSWQCASSPASSDRLH